jgi:hypothetical protein
LSAQQGQNVCNIVTIGTDDAFQKAFVNQFLNANSADSAEMATLVSDCKDTTEQFNYIISPANFLLDNINKKIFNEKKISKIFDTLNSKRKTPQILRSIKGVNTDYASNTYQCLKLGSTIIIDAGDEAPFLSSIGGVYACEVIKVLVYTDPHRIIKNMISRNYAAIKCGNIANTRFFFPYQRFCDLYELTDDCKNALDHILKFDVKDTIKVFEAAKRCAGVENISASFFLQSLPFGGGVGSRDRFINTFFPNSTNEALIKAKKNYDFILYSGKLSPEECAEKLLPLITKVRLCE